MTCDTFTCHRYPHDLPWRRVPVHVRGDKHVRDKDIHDMDERDTAAGVPGGHASLTGGMPPEEPPSQERIQKIRRRTWSELISHLLFGRREECYTADEMKDMAYVAERHLQEAIDKAAPQGLESMPPHKRLQAWRKATNKAHSLHLEDGVRAVPVFMKLGYVR